MISLLIYIALVFIFRYFRELEDETVRKPERNWAFSPNSEQGWTAGDKTINIMGVNAARTSASDAAVATLISKSVNVLTN